MRRWPESSLSDRDNGGTVAASSDTRDLESDAYGDVGAETTRGGGAGEGGMGGGNVGTECRDTGNAGQENAANRVRIFMRIAYDGRGFHGFAYQPEVRTVAGVLSDAFDAMSCSHSSIVCAGRTDAGVHAKGQVVHVDVDEAFSPRNLAGSLNRMLAPEVVIREAGMAPPDFHARYSATARSYRYTILNSWMPDPLMVHRVWHVREPLDVRSMRMAADCILGAHDFSAFCRRRKGESPGTPIVREVFRSELIVSFPDDQAEGRVLMLDISGGSFCHQMVKSLVGTYVEVGRGRLTPADVYCLLQSPAGSRVSTLAPSAGLCLMRVDYDGCELRDEYCSFDGRTGRLDAAGHNIRA